MQLLLAHENPAQRPSSFPLPPSASQAILEARSEGERPLGMTPHHCLEVNCYPMKLPKHVVDL